MKKLIVLVLLLGICYLFAESKTWNEALDVAEQFLRLNSRNVTIGNTIEIVNKRNTVAYVYEIQPQGFIAVSADSDIYPIIAYSYNSNFTKSNDQYSLNEMLRLDLELRAKYYKQNPQKAEANHIYWDDISKIRDRSRNFQQWPAENTIPTDGWLNTTWNQSGTFNNFCPLDNSGERSVVGCVATAMSMIQHYHEYIGDISFNTSDRYIGNWDTPRMYIDQDHEERDFPEFDVLNGYLDELKDLYLNGNTLTSQDYAALCFAAGVSVEMNYSSGGSGAFTADVPWVLRNKYNYDTAEWIDNWGTYMEDTLIEEAKHMRPTELSIRKADGSGGHAINCDGYNTNHYFHLNFGWGTSDNTCWYSLPYNMPDNYSVITGAAVNIEGGEVPISAQGVVNADVSVVNAYVTLENDHLYEAYVINSDGTFEIPALWPGIYQATAYLTDRTYYDSFQIEITETNNMVVFNLANYEGISGSVSAPVNTQSAVVNLFRDGIEVSSTIVGEDETFYFADILPGTYQVMISLDSNYALYDEIVVNSDNMDFSFSLEQYQGSIELTHAKHPDDIFGLNQTFEIGCGVKFDIEDLENQDNDLISGISFKSPINSNDGTIFIQLWQDNTLVSEKFIDSYSEGDWINESFDNFTPILADHSYYVGYRILSDGVIAYKDNGPKVEGKGAFIKSNANWVDLNSDIHNFNFAISAITITQDYSTISGNINLNDIDINFSDATIKAGLYTTHPSNDGSYMLTVKPGNYDIEVSGNDFNSEVISNISIGSGENLSGIDFNLNQVSEDDEFVSVLKTSLGKNHPNPFNPNISNRAGGTVISYSLKEKSPVKLSIYNILGQKVKILLNKEMISGNHSVTWNGNNESDKPVASGVYFYKLETKDTVLTKKMLLMK